MTIHDTSPVGARRQPRYTEVGDLLPVLRRSWILLVVCTLLGGVVATGVCLVRSPTYRSQAELFVASTQQDEQGVDLANLLVADRIQSYVDVAQSSEFAQTVVRDRDLSLTPSELQARVQVSAEPSSVVLHVSVAAGGAGDSQALTQAVAEELRDAIEELETPGGDSTRSLRQVRLIQPASLPTSVDSPRYARDIGLGALFGVVVGMFVAVARDRRGRGADATARA